MFGEKFIERKIEGNKVINISEWKEFSFDYESIAQEINDMLTDDPEELYNTYGIAGDFDSDFVWIDCETCADGISEYLNNCDEDELEEYAWLKEYLKPLYEAKGFTIYFQKEAKDYRPEYSVEKLSLLNEEK